MSLDIKEAALEAATADIEEKSYPVDKFTPSGEVFYALVSGGVVKQYPAEPGEIAEADAKDGCVPVRGMVQPPYDPQTEAMEEGLPEIVGGVWTQTWELRVLNPTPEEPE